MTSVMGGTLRSVAAVQLSTSRKWVVVTSITPGGRFLR